MSHPESGLFGIYHSNRKAEEHWGKNCFNSSFPTALACYMIEKDIPAVYVKTTLDQGIVKVVCSEISMRDVFMSSMGRTDNLEFDFESTFDPYQQYSFDQIDGIDLVIKNIEGEFLIPLEVKLTVLPTSQTSSYPEDKWGSELVVRSATTSYCALGMYDAIQDKSKDVREIFEEACSSIQMWDNDYEMTHKIPSICNALDSFQTEYSNRQKPLLMQTLWKTQGKSPYLADQAFDVIIWSDYAFSRLFIDSSYGTETTMSRPMRATARLARCLWELSKSQKIRIMEIYRQMAFGNQTDKEFAINGTKWRSYVTSDRVTTPIMNKNIVDEVIAPDRIQLLSPERRFDQTLYYSVKFD